MRSPLVGLAALGLLLVTASGAAAHLEAVDASSQSAGQEALCGPLCEVSMTRAANAPPVTVVESGGNVTWTVLEGPYHTVTADEPEDKRTTLVDGQGTLGDPCLDAWVEEPATVTFRIDAGQLEVYDWSAEDPAWRVCEEAVGHGGGAFLLSYHCNAHPRFQNSGVLVIPAR